MKKLLLASTALVAFAGAAAADIEISGEAEMGIFARDSSDPFIDTDGARYWQDIEVEFSLTGESDAGISFGAVIQMDEAIGPETDDNGARVFISGAFGTLTMGDTDGALDWALTEAGNIGNPGSIADDETEHAGYNGSYGDGGFDNQILRYDYAFDAFSFAVSYEQGVEFGGVGAHDGSAAIGVKYALDLGATTVNLGLGYQQTAFVGAPDQEIIGISADAEFGNGFAAGLVFSDWTDIFGIAGNDATHTGIGLGYETGPISVHANYGVFDFDSGVEVDGFGLAAAYDLGGGLSAKLGYGSDDVTDRWSLGMAMEF